jgi:hypothetical protein
VINRQVLDHRVAEGEAWEEAIALAKSELSSRRHVSVAYRRAPPKGLSNFADQRTSGTSQTLNPLRNLSTKLLLRAPGSRLNRRCYSCSWRDRAPFIARAILMDQTKTALETVH